MKFIDGERKVVIWYSLECYMSKQPLINYAVSCVSTENTFLPIEDIETYIEIKLFSLHFFFILSISIINQTYMRKKTT